MCFAVDCLSLPYTDATAPTISGVSFPSVGVNGNFGLTFTVTSGDALSTVQAPTADRYTFAAPVLVAGTTLTSRHGH